MTAPRGEQFAETGARQQAVQAVTATLMDWFPHLAGMECEVVAKLAVAACERHIDGPGE